MLAGTLKTDVKLKELLISGKNNKRMSKKNKTHRGRNIEAALSFLGCLGKTKNFLSKLPVDFCRAPKLLRSMGVACVHRGRAVENRKTDRQLQDSQQRRGPGCPAAQHQAGPTGKRRSQQPPGHPWCPLPVPPSALGHQRQNCCWHCLRDLMEL